MLLWRCRLLLARTCTAFMCSVVVLAHGVGHSGGHRDFCPRGCHCSAGAGGDDCGVTVECGGKLKVYPKAEDYPQGLDCLYITSQALGKLTGAEKERGLLAIPRSVRRLDLSECRLGAGDLEGSFPAVGLAHLPELRVLNLEFNNLRRLPDTAFYGLRKLKVLWLTGNHYQRGEREYKRMAKAANFIEELHPRQFVTLEGLQVLLLHHNALRDLPDDLFAQQAKLRVLKLLDNPFKNPLDRSHPAFRGTSSAHLQQLDLQTDSGDDLEDYWERTRTYLSDSFLPEEPAPRRRKRLSPDDL